MQGQYKLANIWTFVIIVLLLFILFFLLTLNLQNRYQYVGFCDATEINPNADNIVSMEQQIPTPRVLTSTVINKPVAKPKRREDRCRLILENLFGRPFPTVRPNFLKNPETGRNLELDCYNEELKLALEYNGVQHYKYPNPFHKTEDQFIQQKRRDKYKAKICDKKGIYLITVPYHVKDLESFICDSLPKTLTGVALSRLIS